MCELESCAVYNFFLLRRKGIKSFYVFFFYYCYSGNKLIVGVDTLLLLLLETYESLLDISSMINYYLFMLVVLSLGPVGYLYYY